MQLKIGIASAALLLGTTVASAQTIDTNSVCKTCKPCEDFYHYVNDVWLQANPTPSDRPEWSHWDEMSENNLKIERQILESAAAGKNAMGSNAQKIGDYFFSAMDTNAIERAGLDPIRPEFAAIDAVNSTTDLVKEFGRLQQYDIAIPFGFGSEVDPKNSSQVIASTGQGGLGLPDKGYYQKQDPRSNELRDAYVKHIAAMLSFTGEPKERAESEASQIMGLEMRLAQNSKDRADLRDPDSNYHMYTISQLNALTPHFDWKLFLQTIGYPSVSSMDVGQPQFFSALDNAITTTPLATWKAYMKWHLLSRFANQLPKAILDENFSFNKRLSGVRDQMPRWKRSIYSTDYALGEALGSEFVKVAFPPSSKDRMMVMINNLKDALRADISGLTWIDNNTRAKAITKLNAFVSKIGYPDKWRDYSSLMIDRGPYVLNSMRASQFSFKRDMNKVGKPVDKTEWGMTPPTINAYYNPSMNEIVFPAGILQPPFFDATVDDAFNYGAIGAVIGHEMTHGFDDEGAKFDAEGNLKNWWSDADMKQFEDRAKCVIDQFNSFTIEDSIHLIGEQVVGESIADLGGVNIAYKAFLKSQEGKPRTVIGGFTPEQRFFLGYARVWAANARPEFQRLLVNTDFHPLNYFRVIGPLSNFLPFAQAFHCKEGDKMVRPAGQRCEIW